MKYYLIAGERSGDLHGGNLIKALKHDDPESIFRGFGGNEMEAAGMVLTTHYREMAFMGFAEVLANLRTISKKLRYCKEDILNFNPRVIILIDYAGFNLRIARFAKENGIKVFWYISPKVWAWNQKRAFKLKAYVDQMFVILPFEKEFFEKYDWQVDYVGSPVLDAIKKHKAVNNFLGKYNLPSDKKLIALLPGSRKQELQNIIPLMASVVERFPNYHFAVAIVSTLNKELYQSFEGLSNITFIEEATYDLLLHAHAAIVTSGTATLETALFKVPQVVVYRTSYISYCIAKQLIKVPFISLVNLIAGKEVVKELIQKDANVYGLSKTLSRILDDASYRRTILEEYDRIINILDTGSASDNTARMMIRYLKYN